MNNERGISMGIFDNVFRNASSQVNHAANRAVNQAVNNAVNNAAANIGKGKKEAVTFTFNALPTSVAELQALPEANLDSAFKTTALALAVLCNYEKNPAATIDMLNFLKGPESVSTYEQNFIKERLVGKFYKPFSFFAGATVENNYTPSVPYQITVSTTPYSFDEENWATLYVTSAGADSPRPIKLRKKPSTGQWFITEIQCLSDIRIPAAADPWA